jgi:hypothetical protein
MVENPEQLEELQSLETQVCGNTVRFLRDVIILELLTGTPMIL